VKDSSWCQKSCDPHWVGRYFREDKEGASEIRHAVLQRTGVD
jgi:hypothetical protein